MTPSTGPAVIGTTTCPPGQVVRSDGSETFAASATHVSSVASHRWPLGQLGTPEHAPAAHTSFAVHETPSSQGAVLFEWTQPENGSHASSVQTLPSAQFSG